jgi:energy-converting hydrogenase Eha subunit E
VLYCKQVKPEERIMNLENTVVGIALVVIAYAASRIRTLAFFQKKPPANH